MMTARLPLALQIACSSRGVTASIPGIERVPEATRRSKKRAFKVFV
jgi:hypothetical protein